MGDPAPCCWPACPKKRETSVVKDKLVKNTYYEKYKTFRAKTFQLLNHVDKYVDELKTLMVEKFQIVKTQA